jgi:hypothetical protein
VSDTGNEILDPAAEKAESERRRRLRDATRRRREIARRRLAALGLAGLFAFIFGVIAGSGGSEDAVEEATAETGVELPRGGRTLLPNYRLVGFYGAPGDEALGALGIGSPDEAMQRLVEQARGYRGNRPVMPVAELLATTATTDPGEDGLHRIRQSGSVIREYLDAARKRNAILLLDIQPGRADFVSEMAPLKRYLREPDVGLALDPEWHVGPDEVPGEVIGSVDVETVDEVSAQLQEMVDEFDLPEKLFVVHNFTQGMIEGGEPRDLPGIATVINVDGFGDPASKIDKYRQLRPPSGSPLAAGFKLFYNEDVDLMAPDDVLTLSPKPDLVVYE